MADQQRNKVILTEVTLGRLRELQNTKIGDAIPEWMNVPNGWGTALSQLAGDAADLIEWCKCREDMFPSSMFPGSDIDLEET